MENKEMSEFGKRVMSRMKKERAWRQGNLYLWNKQFTKRSLARVGVRGMGAERAIQANYLGFNKTVRW